MTAKSMLHLLGWVSWVSLLLSASVNFGVHNAGCSICSIRVDWRCRMHLSVPTWSLFRPKHSKSTVLQCQSFLVKMWGTVHFGATSPNFTSPPNLTTSSLALFAAKRVKENERHLTLGRICMEYQSSSNIDAIVTTARRQASRTVKSDWRRCNYAEKLRSLSTRIL